VEQPLGYQDEEYPNHVYKLHKALLGFSKTPEYGMNALGTFSLTMILGLVKPTQLSSQEE
jgi:hypothetical protein